MSERKYEPVQALLSEIRAMVAAELHLHKGQRIQTKTKLTPLELRRQFAA